jgi:hypothetical protein
MKNPVLMDEAGAQQSAGATAATTEKAKTREVEKVLMEDGRTVEFVGKRKLLKETVIDGAQVNVRLDFRNGKVVTFTIPDDMLLKSAGHGMEQKLGDETAGTEDVDDMVMDVQDLASRLGDTSKPVDERWTTKREGGGFAGASMLVQALVKVTGKDIETVKAFLKAKVDAGTTYAKLNDAFSEDETVGPVIKELRKAKAGDAKVDTKALLGGLAA